MHPLLNQGCQPMKGQPALSDAQVVEHLKQVPGWSLVGGAIEKSFSFKDDLQALAFVNAVGWLAHSQDHHPAVQLLYSRCTLRFDTHDVGGLSINDFICAAKVDALQAGPHA
jgi:4a-hydroxytetrahydrobiopterin dehydratase